MTSKGLGNKISIAQKISGFSRGLGKILALGACIIGASAFSDSYALTKLKPGDKTSSGESFQGTREDIIEEMLNKKQISLDEVSYDQSGAMIIKKKDKKTQILQKEAKPAQKDSYKVKKSTEPSKWIFDGDADILLFSNQDDNSTASRFIGSGAEASARISARRRWLPVQRAYCLGIMGRRSWADLGKEQTETITKIRGCANGA